MSKKTARTKKAGKKADRTSKKQGKHKKVERKKDEREVELQEGLEETFPASDAPAATQPVHKPKPSQP